MERVYKWTLLPLLAKSTRDRYEGVVKNYASLWRLRFLMILPSETYPPNTADTTTPLLFWGWGSEICGVPHFNKPKTPTPVFVAT